MHLSYMHYIAKLADRLRDRGGMFTCQCWLLLTQTAGQNMQHESEPWNQDATVTRGLLDTPQSVGFSCFLLQHVVEA